MVYLYYGKVKPLSPQEINIELPNFVIEAVNIMIKKKYRGKQFTITCKEIIAAGRRGTIHPDAKKDWYEEKWLGFEKIYIAEGWGISYTKPDYTERDFDSYYTFDPKRKHD